MLAAAAIAHTLLYSSPQQSFRTQNVALATTLKPVIISVLSLLNLVLYCPYFSILEYPLPINEISDVI